MGGKERLVWRPSSHLETVQIEMISPEGLDEVGGGHTGALHRWSKGNRRYNAPRAAALSVPSPVVVAATKATRHLRRCGRRRKFRGRGSAFSDHRERAWLLPLPLSPAAGPASESTATAMTTYIQPSRLTRLFRADDGRLDSTPRSAQRKREKRDVTADVEAVFLSFADFFVISTTRAGGGLSLFQPLNQVRPHIASTTLATGVYIKVDRKGSNGVCVCARASPSAESSLLLDPGSRTASHRRTPP